MEPNHKSTLDYNEIVDGIFIGTNQCCQLHFDEILAKQEGISADISLEEKKIDQPFGVEFYAWMPVVDHQPPTQDQLTLGAENLKNLVRLKKKVYVHCKNGHGRAPTLMAAYLILKGKTTDEALALINDKRPTTHIQKTQIKALKDFAKTLRS